MYEWEWERSKRRGHLGPNQKIFQQITYIPNCVCDRHLCRKRHGSHRHIYRTEEQEKRDDRSPILLFYGLNNFLHSVKILYLGDFWCAFRICYIELHTRDSRYSTGPQWSHISNCKLKRSSRETMAEQANEFRGIRRKLFNIHRLNPLSKS